MAAVLMLLLAWCSSSLLVVTSAGLYSKICPEMCACYVQGDEHVMNCVNAGFKVVERRFGSNNHQVVDYSDNKLRVIEDDDFSIFENVRFLNISHNFIKKVSKNAFSGCQWMEWLDLSHNELRLEHSLDPEFLAPTQVSWLSLAGNYEIGNELLRKDASQEVNKTAWIESNMVRNLSLARCNLARVPPWLVKGFTSLTYLDLSSNLLKVLPTMTIVSLCRIHTLVLTNNTWECRDGACNNFRSYDYMVEEKISIINENSFCPTFSDRPLANCDTALVPEEKLVNELCRSVPVPEHRVWTPPLSFWMIVGIIAGCLVGLVFLSLLCNTLISAICKKRTKPAPQRPSRNPSFDEELALHLKKINP